MTREPTVSGIVQRGLEAVSPGTSLPEDLVRRIETSGLGHGWAYAMSDVLQSERDKRYWNYEHHRETVDQKRLFHVEASDLACEVLGLVHPPTLESFIPGPLGDHQPELVAKASEDLARHGFHVWPQRLAPDFCDHLEAVLSSVEFAEKETGRIHDGYSSRTVARTRTNTAWLRDLEALVVDPLFQRLAFDGNVIDVVQRYLATMPVHVQTNAWWSTPASSDERARSASAQLFHQDKEFIRFVKVFIYLTDVGANNGPHAYVDGSHRSYQSLLGDETPFSTRLSDEQIRRAFGTSALVPVVGQRGTVLFADTSGFHKGSPVLEGHRLLAQLEYACSLYWNPVGPFRESSLDEPSRNFRRRAPRVFENYDDAAHERWHVAEARQRRRDARKRTAARAARVARRLVTPPRSSRG